MRSDNPAISIVMPTYNVGKYIAFCIESIIRQSFQDFELIVIDDVSTDDTYEILQRYAYMEGIKVLRNSVNKGAWYIRNIGRKQAKGKYIFFMDSDDELLPWALEDLYKKAEEEQADIVHNNRWCAVYTEERMLSRDFLWKRCKGGDEEVGELQTDVAGKAAHYLRGGIMPMPWLNLCRRDFLEAEEIEFPPMFFGDDTVFSMEICIKSKKYVRMNEPMYLYRCFPYQKERTMKRFPKAVAYLAGIVEAYKKMFDSISEEELSLEYRRYIISQMLFTHIHFSIYDIMDTKNDEDFAVIKRCLVQICGEGAEMVAYLLYLLQTAVGAHEQKKSARDDKIAGARNVLGELEKRESKFRRNYSYIYTEANLAVHLEGGDDDFYSRAYKMLADAALELCQYKEAVEAYDKATAYTKPSSERFLQIIRKRNEAEYYLEDEWEMEHLSCHHNPVTGSGVEVNRHITFGTIVHYKQITDEMIRLWIEILARVPGAVLLVKADEFTETAMMVEAGERFLAAGIDLKRMQCKGIENDTLSEYRDMDIFLSTYPIQEQGRLQNAVDIGVPVVALCGPKNKSHFDSIMNRERIVVASSGEEYVCRAVDMARNI